MEDNEYLIVIYKVSLSIKQFRPKKFHDKFDWRNLTYFKKLKIKNTPNIPKQYLLFEKSLYEEIYCYLQSDNLFFVIKWLNK